MATNSTANVSATKGIKGGYIFVAPVGTTLPTGYVSDSSMLDSKFECLGFIGEDGIALSEESEATTLNDCFGDTMDETYSNRVESAQFTPAEIKAATLKVMYGDENVTDANGTITVKHNSNNHSSFSYVLLMQLKNGRKWTHVVPEGKSSELDTLTISSSELASRAVTVKYMTDADGQTSYDYFESTETATSGKSTKSTS